MVFSSIVFLCVFLPIVLIMYHVLGLVGTFVSKNKSSKASATSLALKIQNIWLLIASLIFYAWGEPEFIFIMVGSILINYVSGLAIAQCKHRWSKRLVLTICLIMNLGTLSYFKYFSTVFALIEAITSIEVGSVLNVVLPIGISFYTFQALSYVIDVHRGISAPQKNLLSLALYITLFPQLVAGPIVKYKEISEQLALRSTHLKTTIEGIERFVYGLLKKVLIANQLAVVVDQIYALPAQDLSTSLAWAGALMYTLQIYFDFSGYSDMAIGLGLMFGFTFPENFNLPYLARSIREFWRRWHISLSTWFRDYLYIPLGGNRKGTRRTYINLFIVFLATGVWHGAGISFIIWGLYHGFFMIIERAGMLKFLDAEESHARAFLSHLYALLVVVIGWVFFRAASIDDSLIYLQAMFTMQDSASYGFFEIITMQACAAFFVGVLLCGPLQTIIAKVHHRDPVDFLIGKLQSKSSPGTDELIAEDQELGSSDTLPIELYRIVRYIFLMFVLIICLITLAAGAYNPFIYFRF